MALAYWVLTSFLAVFGTGALLVSGVMLWRLVAALTPALEDARLRVRQLGDDAAHATGRAADTMAVVESRVSQAMGEANRGGREASRSAMGLGGALAGLYLTSRVVSLLRANFGGGEDRRKGRGRRGRR